MADTVTAAALDKHAAQSHVASEPAKERIARFSQADYGELAEWLLWRLKDRYPQVHEKMLAGWLQGEMNNNEVMFLRLGAAVGMVSIGHKSILDSRPTIEEVFVLVKGSDTDGQISKPALAQGAELYGEFLRWGHSIGATEFMVERMSDVPREMIKSQLGRMFSREVVFTKLTQEKK